MSNDSKRLVKTSHTSCLSVPKSWRASTSNALSQPACAPKLTSVPLELEGLTITAPCCGAVSLASIDAAAKGKAWIDDHEYEIKELPLTRHKEF